MIKKLKFHMLPIVMVFLILPFCIRLHMIETDLFKSPWFPNQSEWGDFFLYARSKMILLIAGLAVLILADAFLLQREKFCLKKSWFLLGGYAFFCVMSALLSDKKEIALQGGIEQFEGLWVLLSYVAICFYGCYIAKKKGSNTQIFTLIIISCFVLSFIGILQIMGKDILQTDAILSFIIPEELKEYRNQVSFNFTNESMNLSYMTLYNPNYVGSFAVLCAPVLIGAFFETEQKVKKSFVFVTYLLLMISLFGSQSKTGIIICIWIQLHMLIMWISSRLKVRKVEKWFIIAGFIVVSVGIFSFVSLFAAMKQNKEMNTSLDSISLEESGIEVSYKQSILQIDYRLEQDKVIPVFKDANGLEPPCEYDVANEEYLIQDENLKDLRIGCYENQGMVHIYLAYNGFEWLFVDEEGNHKMRYVTIYGKTDTIEEAVCVFLKNFDSLFTYRGYIWGRTIPLLKDKLLWGSGPDTFIYEFPQNDYVSRSHAEQGFFKEILTKPHSMYLQMALQTGIGSLVCFLIFVLYTLKKAFDAMKSSIADTNLKQIKISQMNEENLRIPILMYSILGYMMAGIFDDSTVAVAPVLWLMLGLLNGSVENKVTMKTKQSEKNKRGAK